MLVLFAGWAGGAGETGLSEDVDADVRDEAELENLNCALVRENVGVTGDGDATSDEEELWV